MKSSFKNIVVIFITVLIFSSIFASGIPGYKQLSSKFYQEVNSTVMTFNHEKSGATIVYLKNDDPQKTFCITFKTPAYDNTGVNHILEHSVLCGSKNFPVRGGITTFRTYSLSNNANAFTIFDNTRYPFSTYVEKDYMNLIELYLDGVFNPNLTSNPNIFKQEAWRYELNTPDSTPDIVGVVYNEMKGALSDPNSVLLANIYKSLFPDTPYSNFAAGDPAFIPDLTRERYLEVYKKHYTPSNSIIYLYGKMDYEKVLKMIDTKYLSKLSNNKTKITFQSQKLFKTLKKSIGEYGVNSEEETKNRSFLTYNWNVCDMKDKETFIAFSILSQLLTGNNFSPVNSALYNKNISSSVSGTFYPLSQQTVFSIKAENTTDKNTELFEKTIRDTLKKIVKEGFDKKQIESIINQYELSDKAMKNKDGKGMIYNQLVLFGWLYSSDPALYLNTSDVMTKIKKESKNRYFEKLVEKYLLNNTNSSIVVLNPSTKATEQKKALETKRIVSFKSKLTSQQLDNLVKETSDFRAWQTTPDSPEAMSTIPKLELTDISTKIDKINYKVEEFKNIKLLFNNLFTNDISYIKFYFDTKKVPQDKIKYLSLLPGIIANSDTEKYTVSDISTIARSISEGIVFSNFNFTKKSNPEIYDTKFSVAFNCLASNIAKNIEISDQMFNHIKLNKETLRQVLLTEKAGLDSKLASYPFIYEDQNLYAALTEYGKYSNEVTGLPYRKFIDNSVSNFDSLNEELLKNIKETMDIVFTKENLVVSYTGSEKDYKEFKKSLDAELKNISDKKFPKQTYTFTATNTKTALISPSDVNYVFMQGNFIKEGYKYSGKMLVFQKLLYQYLFSVLREQGGAYDIVTGFTDEGIAYAMSYRDPKLVETLNVYSTIPQVFKGLSFPEESLKYFIISTFSSFETGSSPITKAQIADNMYFMEFDNSWFENRISEVLSTKVSDLREYGLMFEKLLNQGIYGVAGNESSINQNKDLFEEIIKP